MHKKKGPRVRVARDRSFKKANNTPGTEIGGGATREISDQVPEVLPPFQSQRSHQICGLSNTAEDRVWWDFLAIKG